jgi:hypothetical protein
VGAELPLEKLCGSGAPTEIKHCPYLDAVAKARLEDLKPDLKGFQND